MSVNPFGVSGFQQQAAVSGSQHQQASSSGVNPWQDTDLRSSGKPVRGVESFPSVERSLSKSKRDRDFVRTIQL